MPYGKTIQQIEAERAASAEANKKLHDVKVAKQSAFVNAFAKEMDNRDREAEIEAEEKEKRVAEAPGGLDPHEVHPLPFSLSI